jgi:hypothetical protein
MAQDKSSLFNVFLDVVDVTNLLAIEVLKTERKC